MTNVSSARKKNKLDPNKLEISAMSEGYSPDSIAFAIRTKTRGPAPITCQPKKIIINNYVIPYSAG